MPSIYVENMQMEHIMLKGDFRSGRPVPLSIPSSVRREWQVNGGDDESLAEAAAEFSQSRGYEFEWGQIIEELLDQDPTEKDDDPLSMSARWHFVLVDLHNEFLDAGGNLGELSDLAVDILDLVRQDAFAELTPENRRETMPDFIDFNEGNNISAFEIAVLGVENIDQARQWVDSFFVVGVLPILISRLRAENRAASSSSDIH